MKSGYVVANTPTPSLVGSTTTTENVADMEWSDIHKMVERAGGN